MTNNSPTQLLLTRVDHETKLINVMRSLFSSGLMTDVILSCEGQVIYAHRLVLASVSSYFQSIFQSPLVTNQPNPIVILKDMKLVDLKAIIEFIYNGEVRVPENQLESLVKSAETLDISGLSRICTNPMNHIHSSSTHNISPAEATLRDVTSNDNVNNQTPSQQETIVDEVPPKNLDHSQKIGKKYRVQFSESPIASSVQTRRSLGPYNVQKTRDEEAGQKAPMIKEQKRFISTDVSATDSESSKRTQIYETQCGITSEKRSMNSTNSLTLNPVPCTRVKRALSSEDVHGNCTPEPVDHKPVYGKLIFVDVNTNRTQGELLINKSEFTIGRDRSNDCRINLPLVARQHCSLVRDQGVPKLIIKSKDNTKINGKPVSGEVDLHDCDAIDIGQTHFIVKFNLNPEELNGRELIPVPNISNSSLNINTRSSPRKSTSEPKEIPDQKSKSDDQSSNADSSLSIPRSESSHATRSKALDESPNTTSNNNGNVSDSHTPHPTSSTSSYTIPFEKTRRDSVRLKTRVCDRSSKLADRMSRNYDRPRYAFISKRLRAKQLQLRESNRRRLNFGAQKR